MPNHRYRIMTAVEDEPRVREANNGVRSEWPEFMLHDKASELFPELYEKVPHCQFVVVDAESDKTVAIGNSVPLEWRAPVDDLPDTGWDWAIRKGIDDFDNGRAINLLCALQIVVFAKYRGMGLSRHGVQAMRRICHDHGLEFLIAPVRPSAKSDHPRINIQEYVSWKDDVGLPRDPWLRVHVRAGARIIKPCETAMEIFGTAAQWHEWTGITLDQSGEYIIPGALIPVEYDAEADVARYIEPNVWVAHSPFAKE